MNKNFWAFVVIAVIAFGDMFARDALAVLMGLVSLALIGGVMLFYNEGPY